MRVNVFAVAVASCVFGGMSIQGCSQASADDTSPLPPVDPQTRLSNSEKNIEKSNMTPEQKKAALDYVRAGAAASVKMKESADQVKNAAGSPPPGK